MNKANKKTKLLQQLYKLIASKSVTFTDNLAAVSARKVCVGIAWHGTFGRFCGRCYGWRGGLRTECVGGERRWSLTGHLFDEHALAVGVVVVVAENVDN